jgi:hypothetical protein
MTKNKNGLSDIVVTLIIIVLSLVAIGVVWTVVNNLVKGGAASADFSAKCLGVNLEITQANCSAGLTNKNCDVQVMRSGSTTDPITGVKFVFRNETSGVSSVAIATIVGDIPSAIGKKFTGVNSSIINANGISKVEVTPYFTDTSGNQQTCSQTVSFSFKG